MFLLRQQQFLQLFLGFDDLDDFEGCFIECLPTGILFDAFFCLYWSYECWEKLR